MSPLSGQSFPYQLASSTGNVDLDTVCAQRAYLTNLDDFLAEDDLKCALAYWLSQFTQTSELKSTNDITHVIHRTIAALDELINDQLNIIIHNEKFKQLEASWRGLWYLVVQADGARDIKIKVLNINWSELVKDMGRAIEFDQSQLFQKVYNDEYGSPGGEPYGVLIGDYEISHRISEKHPYDDISTLDAISQVAAAAFSPFIASASSALFGMDNFSSLGQPLNLDNIFSQQEYIKWRSLRDKADTRFIGLTLPRTLMRLPYRTRPGSYKGIYFYEKSNSSNQENHLWGNASYAFGGILIREFANVGWFGHIRGVPRNQLGGGLLTTLPVDHFETDSINIASKPLTDVIITDTVERDISNLGFIPLCQCYATPFAAFYSNQSLQVPRRQSTLEANVNAKLSAMLQHVLCGARIAHYIKVIIRDKIGSFITAEECEDYLRNWLFKYTTGREDLEWEEQARYPLREAAVQVKDNPHKSGNYYCVIHLRPHYQLDHLVSELELVTELSQSG
ncbi:MAG: type VI secretion system contractile sheath large subunit [Gammaproteobacteria bacterium]|nr:type VI secretion system contractile sheath large subunit [Gammaproteobacteria bacterium]